FGALLLGSFLGFFFTPCTQAQSNSVRNATITGTLTDPSGAAVIGAQVTAELAASVVPAPAEATATVLSGPEGKFVLALAPGRYRVRIEQRSFEREEREFTLAGGESQTWDVRLRLRQASSSVTVTATTTALQTDESPYPVTVLSHQDIDDRQ